MVVNILRKKSVINIRPKNRVLLKGPSLSDFTPAAGAPPSLSLPSFSLTHNSKNTHKQASLTMSNRYNNINRQNENKGFPKPQQKFIPKNPNSSSYIPKQSSTPTLSNSLRQSSSPQQPVSGPAPGPGTRLQIGETGDWIPAKQDGNFVNYLPQDEAVASGLGVNDGGLDPVESQRVVDLLNKELSRLLKLNPRDFWREVASDTSLHAFLESFLKFRSRWYDFPYRGAKGIVAGVIVGEFELSRRVFMVLYRISSNRDPGAKVSDSLSPNNHAVILQEKKLLDLPKLLDICAIYSHENEDLTRLMVVNAMKAQPGIHDNFTAIMSHFLNIVNTMYQRCSTSLEVLLSSHGPQDSGSSRLHADYLEVMDFINDAIVSMDAFISAYKHAAVFFSCPVETSYGNEELIRTLAKLNDVLLPSLRQGFGIIFGAQDGHTDTSSDMFSNVTVSLKMLSARIVGLGWKLLYFCYLNDEAFDESIPFPGAIKILPAQVEDPVIRADIFVQSFREINEECATVQEGKSRGTFLQTVEKNHQLMSRIELLQKKGWFLLDNEQLQFLSGIIIDLRSKEVTDMPVVMSNKVQIDEDTAIIESKISQIKDLFPDYGKGFLTACLEVYNQNPEEVIQRILEGTLHNDLLSLDTSLEVVPLKSASSSMSRNDKGKGILIESTPKPTPTPTAASSANIVPLVSKLHIDGPPPSSSSSFSVGRYVRKATGDSADSQVLDTRNEKDVAKTAALALQLEYEDEYDDSFDDLGLSVGDSRLEDREINSNGEKSWESGISGSAPSNASKWGSRQKPQFFIKDGKNYSYKVAGSVAAANYNEASIVNQSQKELIHGLGRGGNLPLGAVKKMTELNEVVQDRERDGTGMGERGNNSMRGGRGGGRHGQRMGQTLTESNERENNEAGVGGRGRGWGRGGRGGRSNHEPNEGGEDNNEGDGGGRGNQGNFRGGRGGRRGGGGRNNYRKDQAMKKHFAGIGGF